MRLVPPAVAIGVAALVCVPASVAWANGTTAAGSAIDSPAGATLSASVEAAPAGYWTAERMRTAIPADQSRSGRVAVADRTGGPATYVAGTSAATAAAAVLPAAVQNAKNWPGPKNQPPVTTTGKIFFVSAGLRYVCSGSAVQSAGRDLVWSAGHCAVEDHVWSQNFIFVPAYTNGAAPFGQWKATKLYAPAQWATNQNSAFDVSAAVVAPLGGKRLADAVGAQGIAFNLPKASAVSDFGYPAAPPFNGETLKYCQGTTFNNPVEPASGTIGLRCSMTPGSSGGPWLAKFNGKTGFINGVNSFKYIDPSISFPMYSPYFGGGIQSFYNTVKAK